MCGWDRSLPFSTIYGFEFVQNLRYCACFTASMRIHSIPYLSVYILFERGPTFESRHADPRLF